MFFFIISGVILPLKLVQSALALKKLCFYGHPLLRTGVESPDERLVQKGY